MATRQMPGDPSDAITVVRCLRSFLGAFSSSLGNIENVLNLLLECLNF